MSVRAAHGILIVADQFADAFKRYWAVIATVAGFFFAVYMITAPVLRELGELKASIREVQAMTLGSQAQFRAYESRNDREIERMWEVVRRIEGQINNRKE